MLHIRATRGEGGEIDMNATVLQQREIYFIDYNYCNNNFDHVKYMNWSFYDPNVVIAD